MILRVTLAEADEHETVAIRIDLQGRNLVDTVKLKACLETELEEQGYAWCGGCGEGRPEDDLVSEGEDEGLFCEECTAPSRKGGAA